MNLQEKQRVFPEKIRPLISELTNVIVVKDGVIEKNTVSDAALSIEAQPLDEQLTKAFDDHDPVIKENLKSASFSLLITVKKDCTIKEPINLFIIQDKTTNVVNVSMVAEAGSSAQIREYIYTDTSQTVNYLSRSYLHPSSQLDYIGIVNLDKDSLSAINRQVIVMDNAKALLKTAQLGDGKTSQKVDVDLNGPFAYGEVKTIAIASEEQEVIIHTHVEHKAKNTQGEIEHYGVAANESFLVFEGTGKIHKGMKQSIAHQSNNGVVLGRYARLDANPLLLIDEYDVEASHGAAIGRIDEEQLYYLMSRGLSEKDAQRLIINGFLAPLKDLMENENLKDYIQGLLETKTGR